ncbi:MAG: hypothetical protein HXY28_14725, partial [Hydrogenophilaceae bacterium]|nr:hypothetical protein [Hydrogenophilaceae bacterium]
VPMPVAIGVAFALLVGVGAFFFMRSQSQQQIAVAPPGVTQPAAPSVPQVAAPPPQQVQSMATFTPPSAPQQTGMTQYYQQVQARLQQVSQTLMAQGWQPVGAPYTNQLQQGQTETVPVTMNIGYSFRIVGVCDQDCGDLDLTLKDGMGGIIVQDTATDNLPVVDVLPTQAGNFSLDVLMYNCSNQPCAYGVAMFGRPN